VGWIYVAIMTLLCVTSFFIYELFGGFGPFHVAAIISFISIVGGILAPLLRTQIGEEWMEAHYRFMLWSYVGLVMATGSHFFEPLGSFFYTHTPLAQLSSLAATVFACWGVPAAIGAYFIYGRKERVKARARSVLQEAEGTKG
jgi:uncharacterized membrane protein